MKSTARAALAILGLAALVFASPAAAQGRDMGAYVGVAIGQATQDGQCDNVAPPVTCDDKDSAWKIFGGYQFNRNLAVELGYSNFGEATARSGAGFVTDEASAFEMTGVLMLPLADRFSIYGKLGFYRGELERTSNLATPTGTNSSTGLTFGGGVRFDVTNAIGVRLEYQIYPDLGDLPDVKVMSVGVLFKFQ